MCVCVGGTQVFFPFRNILITEGEIFVAFHRRQMRVEFLTVCIQAERRDRRLVERLHETGSATAG